MRREGRWNVAALAGLVMLLAAACTFIFPRRIKVEEPAQGEIKERKKIWSGRSFAEQTLIQATPSPSATATGWDQERVWSGSDDWEPAVAADPGAPYVYQLTTRFGGTQPDIVFRRSTDGGATWEQDQVLGSNAGDPMIEVADDGTIFAVLLVGGGFKLMMARSFDHGASWTPLENILGRGQPSWGDRPVLAIGPDGQDVYVAFDNFGDSFVVSSHDGGESFNSVVQTSNDGRYWFHSGGAVAPNGDIYFAVADYSSDFSGETHINVLRSIDGGLNWTTTRVDTSAEVADCGWAAGCYFGFLGPSVALAIDPDGLVMIAYHAGDLPAEPQKMYVRTSWDGIVWSDRLQISSADAGVHNGFPALGASRTTPGDFRLVWQDDRNASQVAWNTWLRSSVDGGATWGPALRLSDLDSGAPYKSAEGYSFVYGDYLEMAVDGQDLNHVIWGAGESYSGPGGSWYTRGTAATVLGLAIAADTETLNWMADPVGCAYDVVKGDLETLATSGGDFSVSLLECLEEGSLDPQATDTATVPPGGGFYYLVRVNTCAGQWGTYDSGAASQIGSRDPGVAASLWACP